jgi:hypothetical protein
MKTLTRKEFKELLKDPKYPIIGLAGHSRVGKSYWAQRTDRVRFSFAEPIKDIYKAYTEKCDLPEGFNQRSFLQTLGTDVGREFHKEVWSNMLLQKLVTLICWCDNYPNFARKPRISIRG